MYQSRNAWFFIDFKKARKKALEKGIPVAQNLFLIANLLSHHNYWGELTSL